MSLPSVLPTTPRKNWVTWSSSELPEKGDSLSAGDTFGTVESVKAVSDLYAPVGGEVVEVNSALDDSPENVNRRPVRGRLATQDTNLRRGRPAFRRRVRKGRRGRVIA